MSKVKDKNQVIREVNEEMLELAEKVDALNNFIGCDEIKKVSAYHAGMLKFQLAGMKTYLEALILRLEDLKGGA